MHTELNITNIDEPIGNFLQIFPELEFTRDDVRNLIESTGKSIRVIPLDYFVNVGNGMNTERQQQEIAQIIPKDEASALVRAELALKYIEEGNHIGVSQEQFVRDLAQGKNHDEAMKYFLRKILAGEKLEPCIVVVTGRANSKFGSDVDKVILDGTHRAVVAAVVDIELEVIEFSIN